LAPKNLYHLFHVVSQLRQRGQELSRTPENTVNAGPGTTDEKPRAVVQHRVAEAIRRQIREGAYRPGDKLPSVRQLSQSMEVSITTVSRAYAILGEEGYVLAHPQSGYYVKLGWAAKHGQPQTSDTRSLPRDMNPALSSLLVAGQNAQLFPIKVLTASLKRTALAFNRDHADYGTKQGNRDLREQIAHRLVVKGCLLHPDDLLVTSGSTEALLLAARAVTKPGDTIAMESPAYSNLHLVAHFLSLNLVEVNCSPVTGMDLGHLQDILDRQPIGAVFATPSFNNPTGSLMPYESRRRLVAMLAEREIPLLENEAYADLHFSPDPIPNCKAFDRDGRVLLCGSFSQTLGPKIRIGWLAPGRYYDDAELFKYSSSVTTPLLQQRAMTDFLERHRITRVIAPAVKAYQRSFREMATVISESFPAGTTFEIPQGGSNMWVVMPESINGRTLQEKCIEEGFRFFPGENFSPTKRYKNCLTLCVAHWGSEAERQVRRIGTIAHGLL